MAGNATARVTPAVAAGLFSGIEWPLRNWIAAAMWENGRSDERLRPARVV